MSRPFDLRLDRINAVLLSLDDDFEGNVQRLTAAAGELLEADFALYHRLEGNVLHASGQWQAPPGFATRNSLEGLLCSEVIRQTSPEARVVTHLQASPFARTDPAVTAYGLRTYAGCPVRFGGKYRGSLCVVFTRDHEPPPGDLQILRLLASTLGQEEERTRSLAALQVKDRAIDASLSAIALADNRGRLTYVNPAFLSLWGYADASEVLGHPASEFWDEPGWKITTLSGGPFPPEQLPFVRVMQTGQPVFNVEHAIVRPDGTRVLLSVNAAPVKDATGAPAGMVASITDITGRRRTEDSLRENEERLRLALTGARQGLFDLNLQTGEATITPEYFTMLGYSPDRRFTVEAWAEMLHPDDRERARTTLDRCIADEVSDYAMEYRLRTRTGEWVWVLSSGKVVARDAAGRATRLIGIHLDITERRKVEQALRETEFFLNKSQEVAHIGSYNFDATAGTWIGSPSLEKIFGLRRDEPRTVEIWTQLVVPEQREEMRRYFEEHVLAGHHRFEREYRITRKSDQQVRWVFGQGEVDYDAQGRPLRMIGTIQDITERKLAETSRLELERRLLHAQKLESLGVFAGGIAHDFNNLLTAILGNLDLALMDLPATSPARGCIEQSATAARRAADLTRQMLAYSGRGSFVIRKLDLSSLVQENAHLFRACISKLVTLQVEVSPNLPRLKGDPGQIQQVVMNLITNASESIGEKPGVVRLRTGATDCDEASLRGSRVDQVPPAGRFVCLEVTDTGCGMDEATQQRLFDPFFTTKFTGRGLGMSAILGIVRGHGGAIFVDSTVGQGTSIRVLFPAEAAAGPGSPDSRPPLPSARPANPGTILIVDDEDVVRRVCRHMLKRHGWEVLEAADGLEAIEVFKQHAATISLVILDLSMPQMGGVEVFRALRAIQPHLRVILSSGYSNDQSTGKKLAAEGLAGFMQKPYSTEALMDALDEALERPAPPGA